MTTNPIFRGVATAIITPTNANGVDYEAFGRIIDWQIAEGINAIVVCGTTGENPTLSDDEHKECIRFCVERVAHRVPVIAGTGSNDTAHAIAMTQYACSVGADAILCVTPYYNKATQAGLVAMFNAIADASTVPMIVYNVPSRTGCGIEPATYVELAKHPRIAAIKEANGDISKIAKTAALLNGALDIYSGNDDQIVPIMSLGGIGVISVLSNVAPRKTVEICDRWFNGDVQGAAALQLELLELINALFCEVNPIPVKAGMAAMGWCENYLRLPLTPMSAEKWPRLEAAMKEQGLI
ncbi:MAG: 4-hydroxy-tetrahydrodipicolinate synthase [Oscillospiraceae bacterium]|nr:4-hydroxy-tetrahydrodipicolinate synthase [Oscillospiraceae bacterium]